MASAGLLLQLMSCSLLVSIISGFSPAKHTQIIEASPPEKHQQPGETHLLVKRSKNDKSAKAVDIALKITDALIPVTALIIPPPIGPGISAALSVVKLGLGIAGAELDTSLSKIMDEFKEMKNLLSKYSVTQTWNTWAVALSAVENEINIAWEEFQRFRKSLERETDDEEIQRHIDAYKIIYPKYNYASKKLVCLVSKGCETPSFGPNFIELFASHFNCHVNDIIKYNKLIGTLIYMGNAMDRAFYHLQNLKDQDLSESQDVDARKVTKVLFKIHEKCVIDMMQYVEKDVLELTDPNKSRETLATEVWSFLDMVYDKYDWMVVVSKYTKWKVKRWRSHVFSNFKVIRKGGISVSVAGQKKGTQTKPDAIIEAIKNCVRESVLCCKVGKVLSQCKEMVKLQGKNIPVSKTYTAVHMYTISQPIVRHNAQDTPHEDSLEPSDDDTSDSSSYYSVASDNDCSEASDVDSSEASYYYSAASEFSSEASSFSVASDDDSSEAPEKPYIYTGDCSNKWKSRTPGKFVVLIKSVDEITEKNPCDDWSCTKRGKCVRIPGTFLPLCDCKYPYYGPHCEETLRT